jgi:hypothetical protein
MVNLMAPRARPTACTASGESEDSVVPQWVLDCPECRAEFTHTIIRSSSIDPFTGPLEKPDFPPEGLRVECPHCKKCCLYKKSQLILRPT